MVAEADAFNAGNVGVGDRPLRYCTSPRGLLPPGDAPRVMGSEYVSPDVRTGETPRGDIPWGDPHAGVQPPGMRLMERRDAEVSMPLSAATASTSSVSWLTSIRDEGELRQKACAKD